MTFWRDPRCANCSDPLIDGGHLVDVDGKKRRWCDECTRDLDERNAGLAQERLLGVYKGDDEMTEGHRSPHFETFEGANGEWWWRLLAGNPAEDELARSSEGYSSKSGAARGLDATLRAGELAEHGFASGEVPDHVQQLIDEADDVDGQKRPPAAEGGSTE